MITHSKELEIGRKTGTSFEHSGTNTKSVTFPSMIFPNWLKVFRFFLLQLNPEKKQLIPFSMQKKQHQE